jgi:lipopolysaccharide export system permease protein
MKGYSRYIFKQLLVTTMFVTFCLTCAIWLTQSLRYIELIVNHGISLGTFLELTILLMPSFLSVVIPVALFSSVLFTFNRLWMDRELIVLRAVGVSQLGLAAPALAVALIVTGFGYAIDLYFMPASFQVFKDMEFAIRNNFSAILLQEGKFNTLGEGITVYVRDRAPDGELLGILVHDSRQAEKPLTYIAERGALVDTPSGPRVVLFNGDRQQVERSDGRLSMLYFAKYSIDLGLLTDNFENHWRRPQERFLHDLLVPDPTNKSDQFYFGQLITEGHQRLVVPLYAIAFTLIGLAALLSGDFNRRGQTLRVLTAIILVILLQASAIGFSDLVGKNLVLLPVVYLNVIIPTIVAALYIVHPPQRRPGRIIDEPTGPVGAAGAA